MKLFIQQNQLLLLGGAVLLLAVVVIVSLFIFSDPVGRNDQSSSSVYRDDLSQPVEGGVYQYVSPEDEAQMKEELEISAFIKTLPYRGEFVRIDYSYEDNSFLIRIDPDNKEKGDAELYKVLNQHSIDDPSRLYNLVVY